MINIRSPPARPSMSQSVSDNCFWYHGSLERCKAEAMVLYPGHFLVRDSCSRDDEYVITCNWQGCPTHFAISRVVMRPDTVYAKVMYFVEDEQFDSVEALVCFYVGNKRPLTRSSQCVITTPVNRLSTDRLRRSSAARLTDQDEDNLNAAIYQPTNSRGAVANASPMKNRPLPNVPSLLPTSNMGPKCISEASLFQRRTILQSLTLSLGDILRCTDEAPPKPSFPPAMVNSNISGHSTETSLGEELEDIDDYHEYCDIDYDELQVTPTESPISKETMVVIAQSPPQLPSRNRLAVDRDSAVDVSLYDQLNAVGRLVDIETIKRHLPSKVQISAYKTDRLPEDLRPMDERVWPDLNAEIAGADGHGLAAEITRVDCQMLSATTSTHPLLPVDLSILLLPQGESLRHNVLERAFCLKSFVQMSILWPEKRQCRVAQIAKWIQVANSLVNGFGNAYAFGAVMRALASGHLSNLAQDWQQLRVDNTNLAVLYERKLRRLYKKDDHAPRAAAFIPDIWKTVAFLQLGEGDFDNADLFDSDDDCYGLEAMNEEMINARSWRNVNVSVEDRLSQAADLSLSEMLRTEFQAKVLWGDRACQLNASERYGKLEQIFALLSNRRKCQG